MTRHGKLSLETTTTTLERNILQAIKPRMKIYVPLCQTNDDDDGDDDAHEHAHIYTIRRPARLTESSM
jgi:hypothetical protein